MNAVKDLQTLLLATGTSPTLALVTNISTQALFQQFEKPDWLNVIHANGAEAVARTSMPEVKVHAVPLGKGEALWCLLWALYLPTC